MPADLETLRPSHSLEEEVVERNLYLVVHDAGCSHMKQEAVLEDIDGTLTTS